MRPAWNIIDDFGQGLAFWLCVAQQRPDDPRVKRELAKLARDYVAMVARLEDVPAAEAQRLLRSDYMHSLLVRLSQ